MLAKLIFYSLLTQFNLHPLCISPITFYILIVLLLAFFSFFIIMIMENAEILHSGLVWKTIAYCGLITAVGIGMVILLAKYLGRRK